MQRLGKVCIGGFVAMSAAIALFGGGCTDIIDFPEATTGGVSSSSSSASSSSGEGGTGGGGGAAVSSSSSSGNPGVCVSNTDCMTPMPICDVPKGTCVECLDAADCSLKPGTVCSLGTCACPTPGDSYCRAPDRCVDLDTNGADCGSCDHPCFGSCVAGKCADAWEPTPLKGAPTPRANHVAVWTGMQMIVWGGDVGGSNTNTGGMFNPGAYRWDPTSTANAPTPRKNARAVWAGAVMVMWGGDNGAALKTGGIFNPATNTWTAMSTVGAPSQRYGHSMVWTGTKVLVWGGTENDMQFLDDGAAYDITNDTWEPISTTGFPPSQRAYHSAVWTGSDMIIFGGFGPDGTGGNGYLGDGSELNPATGMWATVKDGQPSPRARHGSEWTGMEMIIWGGQDSNGLSMVGSRYKPKIEWSVITSDGAPELRMHHSHVWISPRLIIWGGQNGGGMPLDTGALYNPTTNSWGAKPIPSGPVARTLHSSVNANNKLIVFGGMTPGGLTNSGGTLNPMGL